jgi:hypothetical protein
MAEGQWGHHVETARNVAAKPPLVPGWTPTEDGAGLPAIATCVAPTKDGAGLPAIATCVAPTFYGAPRLRTRSCERCEATAHGSEATCERP